jgi:prepilin-type N-terminal cleavage/methylation domain-containing protein
LPESERAFTVLEMIVTLTIVGIVAAVSIPKISNINTQNKVQRAANVLQAEVQQAFAIAGRNRQPIKFLWSKAALQVQVTNRAGTTIYRKTGLGIGSSLNFTASEVTIYPTTLTVFPNGIASDTLYMKVSKSGFSKTVRVSKSGMTRIQ